MTESRRLAEEIAEVLRTRILSGEMAHGDRLREEQIAEEQQVSRVPVREAIQRLEHEGYVVRIPRRGARVAVPSPERVLNVMQVRRALEVFAARCSAGRRGGDVANELRTVLDAGFRAVESNDLSRVPQLIDDFHGLVADASGNDELVKQLAELRNRVGWLFAIDVEHRAEESWSEHAAILEAILSGAEERAAELMDAHVARDEDRFRGLPSSGLGGPQLRQVTAAQSDSAYSPPGNRFETRLILYTRHGEPDSINGGVRTVRSCAQGVRGWDRGASGRLLRRARAESSWRSWGPRGAASRHCCGCSPASTRPPQGVVSTDGAAVGYVFQDATLLPWRTLASETSPCPPDWPVPARRRPTPEHVKPCHGSG